MAKNTARGSGRRTPPTDRTVDVPVLGTVAVPPLDRLTYFAGLGVLAAFGLIDWPVALVIAGGQLLADQHWSRVTRGIGEAMEQA
jgi:hypothetical protein